MAVPRPKFPPLFLEEIFKSRRYRQDFRSFLVKNDVAAPLHFLEAVSGLKHFRDGSEKQLAHAQKIHKKFFGKETNFGRKLQCDDKTIHLIAEADTVCPKLLLAAFIPVYRSMEKIWFRRYIQTFPGKAQSIQSAETTPTVEAEPEKVAPCPEFGDLFDTHSKIAVRKLVQFIIKMQSTPLHKQLIDYVRILYEEEIELMKAVLRPRLKGGKKETERFEEPIAGLRRGDLPNLEHRILFLYDLIEFKTLYNCLSQYGGVYEQKPILAKRANFIIRKYLSPEAKPETALRVPQKMVIEAKMMFKREGPTKTLFHEITLLMLPVVYKIWRAMWNECTKCGGNVIFANIIKQKQQQFSSEEILNLLSNLKKETIIPTNDYHSQFITLNFSVQKGIRVFVPKPLATKEERLAQRIANSHAYTAKDTESVTEMRGGSRLGYVLIK